MRLTEFIESTKDFKTILTTIRDQKNQLITGVAGSAKTLLLAALHEKLTQPQLIIVDSLYHMQKLAADLENLLPDTEIYQFPVEEVLAAEVATSSPNYRLQRVLALNALQQQTPAIVIASVAGLRRKLIAPAQFAQASLQLKPGMELDPTELRAKLGAMGYQYQQMVLRPGDFAMRGSIIDVYALNTELPIRIDLFDTEVDSLRTFDPESQRSQENLAEVTILPATDFILPITEFERVAQKMTKEQADLQAVVVDQEQRQVLNSHFAELITALKKHELPVEMLEYADLVYPEAASLLDYLPPAGSLYLDDWPRIKETGQRLEKDEMSWLDEKMQRHERGQAGFLGHDPEQLVADDTHAQTYLALFKKGMGAKRFAALTDLKTRPMQRFFGQMALLKSELQRWQAQGETIVLLAQSQERRQQMAKTMAEFGVKAVETQPEQLLEHQTQLTAMTLANGFEYPQANLVAITENEMFAQVKQRRVRPQKLANAERLKSYADLKPGDYVVHVNHGIGIFSGIKTMTVDGANQDYMVINYRNHAQIFVPVTQLDLVQKYVASEGKVPHVNRLGGTEWAKTKARVAARVEDIADELVDLYAARETEKGYAFPKDDYLQEKFEAEFPYQETPDQLRSIKEIKADMESERPMDRLLVGDVGYGKTEVALRAVFKAVLGGKQVAFLVPTTILAQQHYDTMKSRFEGFPIEIAMMSRFRTPKQLKETEAGLKNGKIDVVVGTHRLLSKDVQFNDLGLLVIDEEQRFGVKHKERLKQLKNNIDVLTLTATPIPRTLHMSMMGVRDLSVIETPPADRYPIQTYVMEQNQAAIRDGILRELQRGGQVYYLHNRVNDIERTVAELQELVPEARIGYIHGKMTEAQLEGVLYDFIQGEDDVLVTTSIIETGVDIANVNTLFVENADRMGLSQLYQIRGRIGRSNRVAYAYFMYQPNKVLTELGEKRLAAIRDFTELGSGFKIAMRDLAIRGAGNLLGKQQHGFIDSVGYDLYAEMLSEAVAKKRGQVKKPIANTEIDINVEAYLPDEYVSDSRQKIALYKQVRQAKSDQELLDLQGDLIDRFGDYGESVENLLLVGELKMNADAAMLESIKRQRDNLVLTFTKTGSRAIKPPEIIKALAATRFKATMGQTDDGRLTVRLIIQPKMTQKDWLKQLIVCVRGINQALNDADNDAKHDLKDKQEKSHDQERK